MLAAAAVAFCYTIAFKALFAKELCLWIFSFEATSGKCICTPALIFMFDNYGEIGSFLEAPAAAAVVVFRPCLSCGV